MPNAKIDKFWSDFCAATGVEGQYSDVYSFGDSPDLADALLALILAGEKTASTDLDIFFEVEGVRRPAVGDLSVILNGQGHARAVIRTIETQSLRFHEVGASIAQAEGEGDRSLEYWRHAHRDYYARWLNKHNMTFSNNLMLVVERFELVYPRKTG